jgi:hypothetical protein
MVQAQRLLGVVNDGLIVRTRDRVVRLDTTDGRDTWTCEVADQLDTALCGGEGGIMISRIGPRAADGKRTPILLWLHPETGREIGRWPLEEFSHTLPQLGPAFVRQGRLWLLAGKEVDDQERELIELEPCGPAQKAPTESSSMSIWSSISASSKSGVIHRITQPPRRQLCLQAARGSSGGLFWGTWRNSRLAL